MKITTNVKVTSVPDKTLLSMEEYDPEYGSVVTRHIDLATVTDIEMYHPHKISLVLQNPGEAHNRRRLFQGPRVCISVENILKKYWSDEKALEMQRQETESWVSSFREKMARHYQKQEEEVVQEKRGLKDFLGWQKAYDKKVKEKHNDVRMI